jgi:hypothetical protein
VAFVRRVNERGYPTTPERWELLPQRSRNPSYFSSKIHSGLSNAEGQLKAGLQYELPLGRGHQLLGGAGRVMNAIASGWTISPLLTYASGKPMNFYSNDVYSLGSPAWSAIYVNYDLSGYNGRELTRASSFIPRSTIQVRRRIATSRPV